VRTTPLPMRGPDGIVYKRNILSKRWRSFFLVLRIHVYETVSTIMYKESIRLVGALNLSQRTLFLRAPPLPPKENPGSAPDMLIYFSLCGFRDLYNNKIKVWKHNYTTLPKSLQRM
jgi:hypothetical protein